MVFFSFMQFVVESAQIHMPSVVRQRTKAETTLTCRLRPSRVEPSPAQGPVGHRWAGFQMDWYGEVPERLMGLVSKTSVLERVPGVRIPPSPIPMPPADDGDIYAVASPLDKGGQWGSSKSNIKFRFE